MSKPFQQIYPLKAPVLVETTDTFVCAKHFKRLWIQNTKTGSLHYTHPDFIRVINRTSMTELASKSSKKGYIDINDIIDFEKNTPRASGYAKRLTL